AQGDLRSDGLVFAQFEIGNAFFRQRLHGSLSSNQRKLRFGLFQRLLHVRLRANRSVDHDLLDLWDLMDVLVAMSFLQCRHDVLFIMTTKFVFHTSTDPYSDAASLRSERFPFFPFCVFASFSGFSRSSNRTLEM